MYDIYDYYEHLRCDCGGIVGQWDIRFGFECEKCHKDYNNYHGFDYLLRNDMTGWIFPMMKKDKECKENGKAGISM